MTHPVLILVKFKTEEAASDVADELDDLTSAILRDVSTPEWSARMEATQYRDVGATHPLMKQFGTANGFE